VVLSRNKIHHCGLFPRPGTPRNPQGDHGLNLEATRRARITDNLIYDNADLGLYLFPDVQDSVIARNVIDGNGRAIRIDGSGALYPRNNRITDNAITHSRFGYPDDPNHFQIEGGITVDPARPPNNVIDRNCFFQPEGVARNIFPSAAYTVGGSNAFPTGGPGYRNRRAKDFRLRGGPGECPTTVGPQPPFR
jgi:hypothetical protein